MNWVEKIQNDQVDLKKSYFLMDGEKRKIDGFSIQSNHYHGFDNNDIVIHMSDWTYCVTAFPLVEDTSGVVGELFLFEKEAK